MRKNRFLKLVLFASFVIILVPFAITLLWSFVGRWPWPNILPKSYTLRTIIELLTGSHNIFEVLFSSILLAASVAILSTIIAMMTARATEIYKVKHADWIKYASMLPLVVPGTVFVMGFQVILIRMGLNDSIFGVILVHIVATLPYSITIMADITRAKGERLEEQAACLGASPFRRVFDVIIPQLLPGILSSMSMSFILSYSQYFSTLMAGGGKIKTLALVLVPYIQSGDRALSSIYSVVFILSALLIFFVFELLMHRSIEREHINEA